MTIEKDQPWGGTVARPDDVRFAGTDAAVAAALTDGSGAPVALTGGDLHRTVGGRDPLGLTELLELPIDLLHVTLDGGPSRPACAHVTMQRPLTRGGWWRGEVVMVMNAEFIGEWHIVARGHPNDGRAEVCAWAADFGLRQRWEARRRLPGNRHVPHPQIETRSIRHRVWNFDAPMHVVIDGVPAGTARRVDVVVEADAATIYA
jgi:hypothetical protein